MPSRRAQPATAGLLQSYRPLFWLKVGALEGVDCALLLAAPVPVTEAVALRGMASTPVPTALVPLGEVLCVSVLEEEAEMLPVAEPRGKKR